MRVNGRTIQAKGEFTYHLGTENRTTVKGADRIHGYSSEPGEPMIEGALTDEPGLDLKAMFEVRDATVTLELLNGKTIVLRDAWYAGDGTIKTGEGEASLKFVGLSAQEVT